MINNIDNYQKKIKLYSVAKKEYLMGILIVDDSENTRALLEYYLKGAEYEDILHAETAPEAFSLLMMNDSSKIGLILMDISLPDINGIEACHHIKTMDHHKDTPIVMVTGRTDDTNLQLAFEAGAIDYLTKPINKIELLARIRSVLKLKHEMDSSKKIARQLEEANQKLKLLSSMDELTGIANRRQFNHVIDKEWRRSLRDNKPLSLIMLDIDCFKLYNDNYGHQAGDDCLKQVAHVLNTQARRPGDLVARYGGEEFSIVLPDTHSESATQYADRVRIAIDTLCIPHEYSKTSKHITISMGVATVIPNNNMTPDNLIKLSDDALYQAKQEGRNRIKVAKV
ncbi:MAG: diguanylate cyclase [Planctomycetota bacterium]